ncbi:hypothetical protein RRG08_018046 [Elysia crispata]|uniref:Uncharacterized protein n=1 Tax=Elysia crispata TaxID=231223 RepID=A0AAE1DEQ1_9GAST|nr:hypothetical protein RRG08_018046 [Elysia crispata]
MPISRPTGREAEGLTAWLGGSPSVRGSDHNSHAGEEHEMGLKLRRNETRRYKLFSGSRRKPPKRIAIWRMSVNLAVTSVNAVSPSQSLWSLQWRRGDPPPGSTRGPFNSPTSPDICLYGLSQAPARTVSCDKPVVSDQCQVMLTPPMLSYNTRMSTS